MIVQEIRMELEKYSDAEEKKKKVQWEKQYQSEPKLHGIPTPIVRKVSAKYFSRVRRKAKKEMFQLSQELLDSGYSEEKTIVFDWAFRFKKQFDQSDFHVFESWLKRYVHNWGACDDLCTHAFGAFLFQFPEFFSNVKEWTRSANRWMRRASAVVLTYSIRRKKHLDYVFEIADALLVDADIMVQKGYGWMLKEATKHYPNEIFDYVLKHRREMPRVSLRYAIEKLSPKLKKEAMRKEC